MEGMREEKLYFLLLKSVKRKKAQFRVSTHFVANIGRVQQNQLPALKVETDVP